MNSLSWSNPGIVSVWGMATRDSDVFAWLTARVTARDSRGLQRVPSHVLLGFDLESPIVTIDGISTNRVYADAIRGGGVMGFKSMQKVLGWVEADPKRKAWRYPLNRSATQAAAMWAEVVRSFGRFKYSEHQLAEIYAMHRFGRPVPRDDNEIVCSDWASQVCAQGGIDMLRLAGRRNHDEMSPMDCVTAWELLV